MRARGRVCKIVCKEVKAHNEDAMIEGKVDNREWYGNVVADAYAAFFEALRKGATERVLNQRLSEAEALLRDAETRILH